MYIRQSFESVGGFLGGNGRAVLIAMSSMPLVSVDEDESD